MRSGNILRLFNISNECYSLGFRLYHSDAVNKNHSHYVQIIHYIFSVVKII